jgi:hypothetical protein
VVFLSHLEPAVVLQHMQFHTLQRARPKMKTCWTLLILLLLLILQLAVIRGKDNSGDNGGDDDRTEEEETGEEGDDYDYDNDYDDNSEPTPEGTVMQCSGLNWHYTNRSHSKIMPNKLWSIFIVTVALSLHSSTKPVKKGSYYTSVYCQKTTYLDCPRL